jgi:putative ABC transport system substrate-binding protein
MKCLAVALLSVTLLAAPLAVEAQPPTKPVIGFLHQGSPDPLPLMNAFRQGLSQTGISEGRDVTIEHRWVEGRYDRLPALAADLTPFGK